MKNYLFCLHFQGDILAKGICCGSAVPIDKGVMIAGGFDGQQNTEILQKLTCNESGQCTVEEVSSKSLDFPRNHHIGLLIPDSLCQ